MFYIMLFFERNKCDYNFCKMLPEKDYPKYLKIIYKQKTGRNLNLRNPKTFSEKIQYLKLYDNLPIKTELTDKIAVRNYVSKIIDNRHMKKLYNVYTYFDAINFDDLPQTFALKLNHGCKMGIVIYNKASRDYYFSKNIKDTKKHFNNYMSCNFAYACGFELQYKNIPHRIFAEEYIGYDEENVLPLELEIYCFNSVPKIILVRRMNSPKDVDVELYDTDLNKVDYCFSFEQFECLKQYQGRKKIVLPSKEQVLKMLNYAALLSKNFKFVRVDFLYTKDNFYFGELTFTPNSGFYKMPDIKIDEMMGSWLSL